MPDPKSLMPGADAVLERSLGFNVFVAGPGVRILCISFLFKALEVFFEHFLAFVEPLQGFGLHGLTPS
ncbi:hypothetical protein [Desulforudis sp. DRI-14]|jgi:hypothetical protein|uniref:hypothetical protein n=1 Tax=Desulforudis sp. DRI-14 TaxID=3459793 RepID=UPI0040423D80